MFGRVPFHPPRMRTLKQSSSGRALAAALLALAACAEEPALRPNLLLITIDTLRPDALGCYGAEVPTPALDALAERGARFTNLSAASSWTLPSLATLMTGRHAATHGAVDDRHGLDEELPVLAERAAAAGYRTHGIGSHIFLGERYGLQRGFATYDDDLAPRYEERRLAHRQITSPDLVARAEAWLEGLEGDAPWLLWVHAFDPHNEYREHAGFTNGDEPRDLYDGEVRFTDHHLGRLFASLGARGLVDDTLVVVVADHGEEFGEHGGRLHRRTLFEEVVRVPLILAGPGVPRAEVTAPVGMVDLLPTLLDLLDLAPPDQLAGTSLRPLLAEGPAPAARPVVTELEGPRPQRALRLGRWKLVGSVLEDFWFLYDLEEDPGEQVDLASQHPERVAALRHLLEEELSAKGAGRSVELGAEDLEHLEALGYGGEG
jgi:choline-sulfatase